MSDSAVLAQQNTSGVDESDDGQQVQLEILPKAESDLWTIHQNIIKNQQWKHVRDIYNEKANGELAGADKVDEQLATWIMTRDTILDYAVLLLRFLSQVGLMIGGIMIVYAGYRYILNVLEAAEPDPSLIKNAIIGIMVIIFSYAIMRILTRAFLT